MLCLRTYDCGWRILIKATCLAVAGMSLLIARAEEADLPATGIKQPEPQIAAGLTAVTDLPAVEIKQPEPLIAAGLTAVTGPKNRAELALLLTRLCVASLPAETDNARAAEWVRQAVGWWLYQDGAPLNDVLIERAAGLSPASRESATVQTLLGIANVVREGPFKDKSLLAAREKWTGDAPGPAALRWLAGAIIFKKVSLGRSLRHGDITREAWRALLKSFAEECANDRERWLVLTLPTRGYMIDLPYNATEDYPALLAGLSPALRDTMIGETQVTRAWGERTSSVASKVSAAGWSKFAKHLALAREALVRASEAEPGVPFAAARMLTVCQGEGSDLAEAQFWLRKALAAQSDCFPAWVFYFNSRTARWGGSVSSIEQAGAEVVQRMQWDTDFPQIFAKSIAFARDDGRSLRAVLADPVVGKAWQTFIQSVPPAPPPLAQQVWLQANSWIFHTATKAERYADARTVLDRPGWSYDDHFLEAVRDDVYSIEWARSKVMVFSGPLGADVEKAAAAQQAGHYEQAVHDFSRIAQATDDARAAAWLTNRAQGAALEAAWQRGEGDADISALLGATQGNLERTNGRLRLSAADQQSAVAGIWLSLRSTWTLQVTMDAGSQKDASTGVCFGAPGTGRGLVVGPWTGWPSLKLSQLSGILNADFPETGVDINPAAVRTFTVNWDGREIAASVKVGDQTWSLPPATIEAEAGVWMLALTASAKRGPLEGVVISDVSLRPLPAVAKAEEPDTEAPAK